MHRGSFFAQHLLRISWLRSREHFHQEFNMAELLYLWSGVCVLSITFFDFFYTTLSFSGAAFLTKAAASFAQSLVRGWVAMFGRKFFRLSGLMVNLSVLLTWILLIWAGLFLVFSYAPEAIVNNNGKVASAVERLYFTGYVLSTLGLGDFQPVTPFFELLTSWFSFFGFLFFTTSMTYLISVSSAIVQKRTLSLSVRNLGGSPGELVNNLLRLDSSLRFQQFLSWQLMINRHTVGHQAYPVIGFCHTPARDSSVILNLTILDEAISRMLASTALAHMHGELMPLRNAISSFLQYMESKYVRSKAVAVPEIIWEKSDGFGQGWAINQRLSSELNARRKILDGLLKNELWTWHDVYPPEAIHMQE
jgi:hypothetical protein